MSLLHLKRTKELPSKDLEEQVYNVIKKEVDALLGKSEGRPPGLEALHK